jgi:hypothetical protein
VPVCIAASAEAMPTLRKTVMSAEELPVVINEPKHITDGELLAWIIDGAIVISDLDSRDPVLTFRGREQKAELTEQGGRKRMFGTARMTWKIRDYQQKQANGRPRTRRIVRAKLVWLFDNRRLIRPGCTIDHDDDDRMNDAAWNLVELTDEAHSAKHAQQSANGFEEF